MSITAASDDEASAVTGAKGSAASTAADASSSANAFFNIIPSLKYAKPLKTALIY
jgi:hypothetical protein